MTKIKLTMMNKIKLLLACMFLLISSMEVLLAQEKLNEFVITPDGNCPFTIRPGDGEYGFVVINTTLSDLRFTIQAAPRRLVKADFYAEKQQWLLTIEPNDNNYKRYKITMNSKGFKQGEIEVQVKQKESKCFDVNPKHPKGLPQGTIGGHEYVDLGLPSGTLWATCNVGAVKPEDCGDYYSWGETWKKSTYNKDNYRYINGGNNHKLTKYCTDKKYGYRGFTDFVTTLEACDDAATAKWGEGWCTPTINQWEELISNCFWTWTSDCIKIVGSNGNSILLPVAGSRIDGDLNCVGSMGDYWSSSLYEELPDRACSLTVYELYFPEGKAKRYERNRAYRFVGFPIRPVCSFQE